MPYLGKSATSPYAFDRIGVLLVNLGSPDAPTPPALKRYLKEFLWDPRLVELPRPLWWLVLNLIILQTRPKKSAALYQRVWTEQGSPLISISKKQSAGIAATLASKYADKVVVRLAMRYGNPSIADAMNEFRECGIGRLIVLPLYPQYSATTTASVLDVVFQHMQKWRFLPELRTINRYHTESGYAELIAKSIQQHWAQNAPAQHLLFSFHGIPKRYVTKGDPYFQECQQTAQAVAQKLGLTEDRWTLCFQSLFGKDEWLRPYTDQTLKALPARGIDSVEVVCPGFSADCLETLEEIEEENKHYFLEQGGKTFHYIPALNDQPGHIAFLAGVIEKHLSGWIDDTSGGAG